MLGVAKKKPGDVLDYDIDFSDWLPAGDSLVSAVVTADDGLTVDSHEVVGELVKVWLSGGTAGASYKVTVNATTDQGRVKEVDFNLRVAEC